MGYLLTHQRSFLAPYEAAEGTLPHEVELLTMQVERADGRSASDQYQRVVDIVGAILAYEVDYAEPLAATDRTLPPRQIIASTVRGKQLVDAARAL